jgi:acyl-coenzyme A synthetase/AMP-(fatty) acid ligase
LFKAAFRQNLQNRHFHFEIGLATETNDGLLPLKQMLYERWQQVVQTRRNEIALRDLASGRCWTFAQLNDEAEKLPPENPVMIHPQGNSPEFIIAVLRAWRERIVVCPLEAHHQPLAVSPPRHPCCHLKTTPASTGMPRAVAFTQEQLIADAENIVTTMGLRPDWPNLGVISPAYSYGFSSLVLPLLLHGIPLFLVPSPLPVALRCAAHAHWNLTVAAVPALWHVWHKAGAILSNVKLAISAGAPLPLTLERAVFAEHGVKIHNFYGSTECGGIAYDATLTPRENESSVGRPMKNVNVEIGENGALLVRSRAVGETYWPKPEPALGDGIFRTCDLAEMKGGEIFLHGRTDDHINVAGRKVSPTIIEQALREHAAVAECVVFGVPSGSVDRMDLIVACVATDRQIARDELKQFLLNKLPGWQVPREWWFVASISSNGAGKPSRAKWRQDFLENRAKQNVAV